MCALSVWRVSTGFEEECAEGSVAAMVRTDGAVAGEVSICMGHGLQAGQAVGSGGQPGYGAEGEGNPAGMAQPSLTVETLQDQPDGDQISRRL